MINQKQIRNRKLNRLKGYDYSQNGWYYITICVKNRIEYLGNINNEKMEYSRYGNIVLKFWQAIPDHYDNVLLDQWVIMPNHIHGIIVIENKIIPIGTEQCIAANVGTEQCIAANVGTEQCIAANVGTEQCIVANVGTEQCIVANVGTEHCSVPTHTINVKNYGLLSKIVKSFKEISLKIIRKKYNDFEFSWQRSFYDHIIRNEKSLNNIRRYIYYNPTKWELDRNNSENLWM
ncbi:MAG: transposase [Patescibacteria group bacterium]